MCVNCVCVWRRNLARVERVVVFVTFTIFFRNSYEFVTFTKTVRTSFVRLLDRVSCCCFLSLARAREFFTLLYFIFRYFIFYFTLLYFPFVARACAIGCFLDLFFSNTIWNQFLKASSTPRGKDAVPALRRGRLPWGVDVYIEHSK